MRVVGRKTGCTRLTGSSSEPDMVSKRIRGKKMAMDSNVYAWGLRAVYITARFLARNLHARFYTSTLITAVIAQSLLVQSLYSRVCAEILLRH